MPRILAVTTAIAALSLSPAVAPASAASKTRVVSAIAYFQPTTGSLRKFQRGNLQVVFRTNRALPAQPEFGDVTYGGATEYRHTISESAHCYGARSFIDADEKVPGRIRVKIGKDGKWLDTRLTVQKMRSTYVNGAALGCGVDRRTRVQLYNLTETPSWAPEDYFLTANSGPYIEDIGWTGWGSERAVGRGAFVSQCASCGEPETRPAKIILRDSVRCPEYGGRVYRVGILETRNDANKKKRSRIFTGYPCS